MGVSPTVKRRTHVWLEGLGDWAWPGSRPQPEPMPPPWVPSFPRRALVLAASAPGGSARFSAPAPRTLRPRSLAMAALCALAASLAMAALANRPALERISGLSRRAPTRALAGAASTALAVGARDASVAFAKVARSGSTLNSVTYTSAALHEHDSFLVYLPPGFSLAGRRYPVLYLLHGKDQSASAFLELGLQATLDKLIAQHAIPPLIAVMIQGGGASNDWRDKGGQGEYESDVLEVQQLVDQLYPTLSERGARAIAGDSLGGYGAMNVALGHVGLFSVVESWLGFFDGLQGRLRAAGAAIEQSGLHALLYGGAEDTIADPSEDASFAAALRAAGAEATGVVYRGGHTMQILARHLPHMLAFAGRSLALAPGVRAAGK